MGHKLTVAGFSFLALLSAPKAEAQQTPQKVWTLPSPVVSLGYCSFSVNSTTASFMTSCGSGIPAAPAGTLGPVYALVEAAGQVFWRDDGTAASSSAGMPMSSATPTTFSENPLSSVSFIGSASSTQINVTFYAVR